MTIEITKTMFHDIMRKRSGFSYYALDALYEIYENDDDIDPIGISESWNEMTQEDFIKSYRGLVDDDSLQGYIDWHSNLYDEVPDDAYINDWIQRSIIDQIQDNIFIVELCGGDVLMQR